MAVGNTRFDFGNPFVSARILVGGPKGTAYPLWTSSASGQPFNGSGGKDDPLNGLKALAFLSEISVELNLGYIPKIRAVLTPPYEDAIKFLDSELIEFGHNILQVQLGYVPKNGNATLSPVWEGRITPPEVSFGTEIQITLNAQGCGGVFTADQIGAGKTYTGTRREAFKEICTRCGWEVDFSLVDKDDDSKRLFDQPLNQTQAWATDLYMLQVLARDAHAYFHFGENTSEGKGKLVVIPRSSFWAKETPDHIFSMYHLSQEGLGANVYPLLNATTPMKAIWLGGIRQLLMSEVGEKSKTNEKKVIKHEDAKDATSAPSGSADIKDDAEGAVQPLDDNGSVGQINVPGDPNDPKYLESLKKANSEFKAAGMGIPLDIESIGVPTLLPGMVVGILGLGMRLDSNGSQKKTYGVFKVTHTWNTSGTATYAHIVANTASYLETKLGKKPAGPTPTVDLAGQNPDQVKGGK